MTAHVHTKRDMWLTLFAMVFALFMIMLDNTVVNVALPTIQRDLNITSSTTLEWTINAYVLTFASLILLGGKLGDRFGRKRLFIVGLLIFSAASAGCALSTTDTQLIGWRVVQGVGAAIMNPLTLSILVATFPRKLLPTAIGIWAGVSGLGLAIGPLLGGWLVTNYGWASVFWINVPIGIVGVGVAMWAVHESRDPSIRSLDVPGAALVTSGLFLLVFGLIETNKHSWFSPLVMSLVLGGLALLGAFVWWESRANDPMLPLGFFKSRAFAASSIVVALVGVGMFGVIYFVTLYMQNVLGYTPTEAGLRSLPLTAMVIFISPIAGRFSGRIGPRRMMTSGMVLSTLGLYGLAQLQWDSSYNAIWPFYILMGAGLALTMPAVSSTAMAAVDPRKSGIASGVVNASRQVGGALGIAILGSAGAHVASQQWSDEIAAFPAQAQAGLTRLTELVQGGQTQAVQKIAAAHGGDPGPVGTAAAKAFTDGLQVAMYSAGTMTLIAAVVAFVGMRGVKSAAHHSDTGSPAEDALLAVEL